MSVTVNKLYCWYYGLHAYKVLVQVFSFRIRQKEENESMSSSRVGMDGIIHRHGPLES